MAKRFSCPKHLKWMRTIPCLVTGQHGVDRHHLLIVPGPPQRGMGRKAGDQWVVPLVHSLHMELHSIGEKEFQEKYNTQLPMIAAELWAHTGDSQYAYDLIGVGN